MLQLRHITFSHIHIHTTLIAQLRDLYNVPHTHHNLTLCATMLMSSGARRSPHRKGASTRYHGLTTAFLSVGVTDSLGLWLTSFLCDWRTNHQQQHYYILYKMGYVSYSNTLGAALQGTSPDAAP